MLPYPTLLYSTPLYSIPYSTLATVDVAMKCTAPHRNSGRNEIYYICLFSSRCQHSPVNTHYALHIMHCTLCTTHYTLHTTHYTLHTTHTMHCTLCSNNFMHYALYTMYSLCATLHSYYTPRDHVSCALCMATHTPYTASWSHAHWRMHFSMQCARCLVHGSSTACSATFAIHAVQCTLHTAHCTALHCTALHCTLHSGVLGAGF
jgi:hypothetical protein